MCEPALLHPGIEIANLRLLSGFSSASVAVRALMSMICADLSLRIWVLVWFLTFDRAAFFASASALSFPGIPT